jgi:phage/plasmid-associated DNA primase
MSTASISVLENGMMTAEISEQDSLWFTTRISRKKTVYEVRFECEGKPTRKEESHEPPWNDVKPWDKIVLKWGIHPSFWDSFRLEVREKIALQAEEKRAKHEAAAKEGNIPGPYGIVPLDLMVITQTENGDGTVTKEIDPDADKAAKSILKKVPLCKRECDPSRIYVKLRDKPTWAPEGEREIARVLDNILGNHSDGYFQTEVKRRVLNELKVLGNKEAKTVDFEENHYLVGLHDQNGKLIVADLRTGQVRDMVAEDYILESSLLPIVYVPEATCPTIEWWLLDTLGDKDSVNTVLDGLVAGLDRKPWKGTIFIFVGGGDNAKSALKKLVEALFGSRNIQPMDIGDLTGGPGARFAKANLLDKRVVYVSEAEAEKEGGKKKPLSVGSLKQLQGDDLIKGEIKGVQVPVVFLSFCIVIIDTNDPPRFTDNSAGFRLRLRPIRFPYRFVDGEELVRPEGADDDWKAPANWKLKDANIMDRVITSTELSGLFNLLLKRAPELMKTRKVSQSKEAWNTYQGQVNPLHEFCEQFITRVEPNPSVATSSTMLYEKYAEYCRLLSIAPEKDQTFYKYLSKYSGLRHGEKELNSQYSAQMLGPREERFRGYNCLIFEEVPYNTITKSLQVEVGVRDV